MNNPASSESSVLNNSIHLSLEEERRLSALSTYQVMDTEPEPEYDDIAMLAAYVCSTQSAMISFVDDTRRWTKASFNIQTTQAPRSLSLCARVILSKRLLVIPNTLADSEYACMQVVTQAPFVRFYAGAPLIDNQGNVIGTLCVMDTQPREALTPQQTDGLLALARQIIELLKLRRNVEYLKTSEKRLRSLSITDDLTGLYNRRAFINYFKSELARAQRYQSRFSILVVDIDHFKLINDRFGHSTGDQVLIDVANCLSTNTRGSDLCARYGGEEFVVLLMEIGAQKAFQLAERYRGLVETKCREYSVTVSIGVAQYQKGDSVTSCFDRADRSLLQAKADGRNQCVYS